MTGQKDISRSCLPCQWFAACTHNAVTERLHPILGAVPICKRCDEKVGRIEAQVRKPNIGSQATFQIIWPEKRVVSEDQIRTWYEDAVANEEATEGFTDPHNMALELDSQGLISLANPSGLVDPATGEEVRFDRRRA